MKWTTIEKIAEQSDKQWYFNISELAELLGRDRRLITQLMSELSVPHYCIGRSKVYFLPEVIEAIEKTRWKDPKGA